jgi:hypothetical protein
MLTDDFIKVEISNLKKLGNELYKLVLLSKEFIEKSERSNNVKEWFSSIRSACNFGTFLIQNLVSNFKDYKKYSEQQIGYYVGKIAIQSFLEIINAFELSTNRLVESNPRIQELINERIQKKIGLLENGWKSDVNRNSKDFKKEIENGLRRKNHEMKFIRDTLMKHKIIDDLDYKILEFSWDIRNSMHNNFLAIKDIEFSAPGTNLNYSFRFKKGEELYHPNDLKSFYSMTEQIIFIQLKILRYFNNANNEKNKS